jgi:hypothetical protein
LAILRSTLPEDLPISRGSARANDISPVWSVLRRYRGELWRGAFLGWAPNACFYAIAVFLGSYLVTEHALTERAALGLQTASLALMVALTPVAGHLADRFGRKPMLLTSASACLVLAVPLFVVLEQGDATTDLWAELVFAALIAAGMTPQSDLARRELPARPARERARNRLQRRGRHSRRYHPARLHDLGRDHRQPPRAGWLSRARLGGHPLVGGAIARDRPPERALARIAPRRATLLCPDQQREQLASRDDNVTLARSFSFIVRLPVD